jgi:hypothetical protein
MQLLAMGNYVPKSQVFLITIFPGFRRQNPCAEVM